MKALGVVNTELFTVTVHGIKGSLSNIDEVDLISAARKLEKAGLNNRINVIMDETPSFIQALRAFLERAKPTYVDKAEAASDDDSDFFIKKMREFKSACEVYNIRTARSAMADLRRKTWSPDIKVIIDELYLNLIRGDFEKAVTEAEKTGNMTLEGFFVK
jgi:HPt (histidine-containing phosphotransfer) domain-containing protein